MSSHEGKHLCSILSLYCILFVCPFFLKLEGKVQSRSLRKRVEEDDNKKDGETEQASKFLRLRWSVDLR